MCCTTFVLLALVATSFAVRCRADSAVCSHSPSPACCNAIYNQFGNATVDQGVKLNTFALSGTTCDLCGEAGFCPTYEANYEDFHYNGLYACQSGGRVSSFNDGNTSVSITYCKVQPTGVIAIGVLVPVFIIASSIAKYMQKKTQLRQAGTLSTQAVPIPQAVRMNPMAQPPNEVRAVVAAPHRVVEMSPPRSTADPVAPSRGQHFNISAWENGVYSTWFRAAATSTSGSTSQLTTYEARAFLQRSGLPASTLAHVWQAVDPQCFSFNYQNFVMACRLVALVQNGTATSMSQEDGHAAIRSPLHVFPQIDGYSIPQHQVAPAAGATRLSSLLQAIRQL